MCFLAGNADLKALATWDLLKTRLVTSWVASSVEHNTSLAVGSRLLTYPFASSKTLDVPNNPFKLTRPFDARRSKLGLRAMVAEGAARRLGTSGSLRPSPQDQAKLISGLQEEPRKAHDSAFLLEPG